MSRKSLHRWFFLVLAIMLAAFAAYSVAGISVVAVTDGWSHFRIVARVLGVILILAMAILAAWLARRSWRTAKPT